MAVIAVLRGDLESGLIYARRAGELAAESGHFRTHVAALINISQILTCRGELAEARATIDKSLQLAAGNRHLIRSAQDSLANLFICSGDYEECRKIFDELDGDFRQAGERRPHWDELTEAYTRARLAQAEGNWTSASQLLNETLTKAEASGDQIWVRRIRAARARSLGLQGRTEEASRDLEQLVDMAATDPESLSRLCGALAATHSGTPRPNLALRSLKRGMRIAEGLSNVALRAELEAGLEELEDQVASRKQAENEPSTSLDAAVALLELSGHPHILAREAVALLQDSGCVEALALATTGPRGPAVLAADGWTTAEALAAVRAAAAGRLHRRR